MACALCVMRTTFRCCMGAMQLAACLAAWCSTSQGGCGVQHLPEAASERCALRLLLRASSDIAPAQVADEGGSGSFWPLCCPSWPPPCSPCAWRRGGRFQRPSPVSSADLTAICADDPSWGAPGSAPSCFKRSHLVERREDWRAMRRGCCGRRRARRARIAICVGLAFVTVGS